MDSFSELLKALGGGPLAVMATLAIIVAGYLYRAREADRVRTDGEKAVLNTEVKDTLKLVIPISEKLAEGTATLERLMEKH